MIFFLLKKSNKVFTFNVVYAMEIQCSFTTTINLK